MARFSLIRPLDQPTGTRRLLHDLEAALDDDRFTALRLIAAYAKSGPLLRLQPRLAAWRRAGKTVEAVLGIDQRGTSQEALRLALDLFDRTCVTHQQPVTFHPKIYFFTGSGHARVFIGSNNLTVGGTETNYEAAVQIDIDLPVDAADLEVFEGAWTDLLPPACPATFPLDAAALDRLVAAGLVVDERAMRAGRPHGDAAAFGTARGQLFRGGVRVLPESPLPLRGVAAGDVPRHAAGRLAIQIKPHHNGEIFLSVTAAMQNPAFFDWPFTGRTTPKKPGNPSYPQRVPDPIANVAVYGAALSPALTLNRYLLNTVYYEKKREIRITAAPLVPIVPDYSIMILERSDVEGVDYEITIHRPDSPDHGIWLARCNQRMPGGGRPPRRFGWF